MKTPQEYLNKKLPIIPCEGKMPIVKAWQDKEFQLEDERLEIIKSIKYVDWAMVSIDQDKTQIKSIEEVHAIYGATHQLMFANGGDQNNSTIPEADICKELGVIMIDGLGEKIQSSSWLLDKK